MVRQCQVCGKYDTDNLNLSFHSFPSDNNRRKLWLSILNFDESRSLPKRPQICSEHFEEKDFHFKKSGRKFMNQDAFPKPTCTAGISCDSVPIQQPQPCLDKKSDEKLSDFINLGEISSEGTLSGVESLPNEDSDASNVSPGAALFSGNTDVLSIAGPSNAFKVPQINMGKESSSPTTSTASSTREQLLKILKENPEALSNDSVGPSSEFRGTLRMVKRPEKRKRRYIGDLSSEDFATPRKRKRNFDNIKVIVKKQQKKIKSLQGTVGYLRSRITNLKSLLKYLKDKSLLSESAESVVKASLDGPALAIFNRMLKVKRTKRGTSTEKYGPELRSFALTLAFYSPRAYNFVRQTFNKSLPHLNRISQWYRVVDGKPGFTNEALVALKLKTADATKNILCNLVMDEMSIRKRVEWNGSRFTGYVNIGSRIESDELPEAKEALVFMLVCLNEGWKIPVGYFFTNGLLASEKANLVNRCLEFVAESGVKVTSLTFDGAAANISMAQKLGADFSDVNNLKTSFSHPVTKEDVYIIPDPCHMIKLIRNCFASSKVLKNSSGESINWEYVQNLVERQNFEGLHAATKIRLRHLQWVREKMRVRLATQTLSRSVADALMFLSEDLKDKAFQGAAATADFIRKFNDLFDMFNSRSKFAKYKFKRPLSEVNENLFFPYLEDIKKYILGLKFNDVSILKSQRKTGFLGFLICIESLKSLYKTYIKEKKILKYITTYKLSQDHLELFFGTIRSKGGFNNNPTARQFEASYKRLLVKSEISGPNTGNVMNLSEITILTCGTNNLTRTENGDNLEEGDNYLKLEKEINRKIEEYDYLNSPSWDLTLFVEDIVGYISGFVVKKLKSCITCLKCLELLETNEAHSKLQLRKTFGKLKKASEFVISVCKEGEKFFRFFTKTDSIFNKHIKNISDFLIIKTMRNLPSKTFSYFEEHFYDDNPMSCHHTHLIKLILKNYFCLRIHHEVFKKTEQGAKERIRSINTKTILFRNE